MARSILILGKEYKITDLDDNAMQGMLGSAKRTAGTINLSTNQTKESYKETLLHEVIHIVDGDLLLGLSEETVARLAVGLFSAGCRIGDDNG